LKRGFSLFLGSRIEITLGEKTDAVGTAAHIQAMVPAFCKSNDWVRFRTENFILNPYLIKKFVS